VAGVIGAVMMATLACGGGSNDGGGPAPVVATVSVTPTLDTLTALGATVQYAAEARDDAGAAISGKTFSWTSAQTGVASVSPAGGLATAVAEGSTTITASTDGVSGSATLVVKLPAPVGGTIQGAVTLSNSFAIRAQAATRRSASTRMSRPAQAGMSKPLLPSAPAHSSVVRGALQASAPAAVPGEWVVTFSAPALAVPPIGSFALHSSASLARAGTAMRSALGGLVASGRATVRQVSPAILAARVQVASGADPTAVATELRANPSVVAVEPNYIRHAFGGPSSRSAIVQPNDPLLPLQAWHYTMIDLPRAWSLTTGSASVLVAVVDNGIRFDHPGIAANLTNDGRDFVSDFGPVPICSGGSVGSTGDGDGYDADPTDPLDVFIDADLGCITGINPSGNHGLHVAGTIGAPGNDGSGVTGVNWSVRIRPVRACGLLGCPDYDVAQGILYSAGLPADNGQGGTVTAPSRAAIINLSLGGPNPSAVEQNALAAATAAGSLVIAAAGNDGTADPRYPAAFPEALSVSAVGPDGNLASYSSFGPTVDIAAPGGDLADGNFSFGIMSTAWNFQTGQPIYDDATWNGTSMAAPHVSGVAALLLAANPGLTNTQLRARLENFAVDIGTPGVDDQYGHGLVNAYNALTQSAGPTGTLKVFLYNAATGALVASMAAGGGGSYQFAGLAPATYRVYAGQDELADGLFGRALRRWGAFGGTAAPTTITVSGTATTTANFTIGLPIEQEDNGSLPNADVLPVGGYLIGFFSNPTTDVDVARVDIPATGQYTFETAPLAGACGFALEEDTILELLSSAGTQLAVSDDIDNAALNLCSRITTTLTPGTYYLRASAFTGPGAPGLLNRRYSVSARAGT
jgi:serine protease